MVSAVLSSLDTGTYTGEVFVNVDRRDAGEADLSGVDIGREQDGVAVASGDVAVSEEYDIFYLACLQACCEQRIRDPQTDYNISSNDFHSVELKVEFLEL